MWKRGDYAEFIDDTDETVDEVIVLAEDADAATVIRRGQRGTTDATQAAGVVVRKNPLFPRVRIKQAINDVIDNELWPRVWTRVERTLTYSATDDSYDLNAADDDVERMYQYNLGAVGDVFTFPTGWYTVVGTASTTAFATGKGILLHRVKDVDQTVYYTAKQKPRSSGIANIAATIASAVPWRAAAKVLASRYGADTVRDTKDRLEAQSVYTLWDIEFQRLIEGEADRLRRELPALRRYMPQGPRRQARVSHLTA